VRIVTKTNDLDRGGESSNAILSMFHGRSDFSRLDQRSSEIKDNEKAARDLSAQFLRAIITDRVYPELKDKQSQDIPEETHLFTLYTCTLCLLAR